MLTLSFPAAATDGVVSQHWPAPVACWVQTSTGARMDLENPSARDVHLHDIAVGMARIVRFNGHTLEPFSVAQHSMLVLDTVVHLCAERHDPATDALRLAALLHDAHEAYMGDIVSPVAALPGFQAPVAQLKRRLQRAIHARFGLPEVLPDAWQWLIARADLLALATEKRDLMAPAPAPWGDLPEPLPRRLDLHYRYWLMSRFRATLEVLAPAMPS
jgi:5'-deoxynucleotidase YfbR-like HD superfamily hydrolase